jgi:hypothetical protein
MEWRLELKVEDGVWAEAGPGGYNRELLTSEEGHGRVVVGQEAFATEHAPLNATCLRACCLTLGATWYARTAMPDLVTWMRPRRSRNFGVVG